VLRQDADFEVVFLDSTVIRAYQNAAGAAKKNPQALGRYRVGLTTKIHACVEGLGQFRRVATRYDKLVSRFESFVIVASSVAR
jgi:hypothetical protein